MVGKECVPDLVGVLQDSQHFVETGLFETLVLFALLHCSVLRRGA